MENISTAELFIVASFLKENFREEGQQLLCSAIRKMLLELDLSFNHTHAALYEEGELLSTCAICGRDLRNKCHARLDKEADNGEGD